MYFIQINTLNGSVNKYLYSRHCCVEILKLFLDLRQGFHISTGLLKLIM
jgi:hypothetical protein